MRTGICNNIDYAYFCFNKQEWKQNKFWILFCIRRIFFKPAIASVHGIPDVDESTV